MVNGLFPKVHPTGTPLPMKNAWEKLIAVKVSPADSLMIRMKSNKDRGLVMAGCSLKMAGCRGFNGWSLYI